jgi:RND superfamily putative drug exporter
MGTRSARRSRPGRWGAGLARYRYLVLALWVLLLGIAALLNPVLDARLGDPDYAVQGSESARAQALIAEHFPALGSEQDALVFTSGRYAASQAEYRRVVSQVDATIGRRANITALVGPYDAPNGRQIAPGGHVAVALVSMDGSDSARATLAQNIQDQINREVSGTQVMAYLTGSSPLNDDLSKVELRDQDISEGIGIPIALIVLLIAFDCTIAALLPIVIAVAGVGTCLGVLAILAAPLHLDRFVTVIATMIGIGIGIDYSLFVVARFREELAKRPLPGVRRANRRAISEAVNIALRTSGHTIIASGLIVMVALGTMIVINGHIFVEIAVASSLVVICCLIVSITLLPSLLAVLGGRVNAAIVPRFLWPRYSPASDSGEYGWWRRWARFVVSRPVLLGLPTLMLLGLLISPLFPLRLGFDLGLSALSGTPSGRGEEVVATSFAPGSAGPIQVIGCSAAAQLGARERMGGTDLVRLLRADRRVASLTSMTDHNEQCFYISVVSTVPIDSTDASSLVTTIRQHLAPSAFAGPTMQVAVGGLTAQYVDLSAVTADKFPVVIAIVLGLSFCYLVVVFRSLLLPVMAVALNILTTAAALGLTVFVFQQGHGARILGFSSVGTLQSYLPVALFALLFGLSMDYELFLVRRIQEEWLSGKGETLAIVIGVQHTARQITAGAAIMVAVFGSFLAAGVLELKQFGFALAVAVLIDATLIRMLLVPAAMSIAGDASWWLPRRRSPGRHRSRLQPPFPPPLASGRSPELPRSHSRHRRGP